MSREAVQLAQSHAEQEPAFERHFSPQELAVVWNVSPKTITRLFQDRPGVLKIGTGYRPDGKREYMTLRIPASEAEKVHRERSV
jgi:hypothetical protein